jgi:gluconokinase
MECQAQSLHSTMPPEKSTMSIPKFRYQPRICLDTLSAFFLSERLFMKDVGLRSPCAKVGGLVYFGRMVDQIRAHAKGQLPREYQASLGKGLDEHCVNFLGVSYDLLVQYVTAGLSDAAMLQSCFGMGHRPSEAEIYMWNEFMLKQGWHDEASQTLRQLKREEGLTARSEIETIFQLIDVAEGRAAQTNHYDGSCLDQISLAVNGCGHEPSSQLGCAKSRASNLRSIKSDLLCVRQNRATVAHTNSS